MTRRSTIDLFSISLLFIVLISWLSYPGDLSAQPGDSKKSPHYTKVGFFDIHVCNWPKRDLFFMSLFSTTHYDTIDSIDVFYPDGKLLTRLDKSRYKLIPGKGKPNKRVFINHNEIPKNAPDGWYTAIITMNNGEVHHSKDYVEIKKMSLVVNTRPADSNQPVPFTTVLSWDQVEDDTYYKVYIRNLWNEGKLIYTSKASKNTSIKIPDGVLEPGGRYSWVIHARDVNGHPLYGDFNHGSNSEVKEFFFEE